MLGSFALAASWLLVFPSAAAAFDIVQVTDNIISDSYPDVSGSKVVWQRWVGDASKIYLWDGATTTQITDNDTDDRYPAISGSNVVWHGCDGGTVVFPDTCSGGDWEIYMTTIPNPVPSLSFDGLALLAGLLLGSVAWARWRR